MAQKSTVQQTSKKLKLFIVGAWLTTLVLAPALFVGGIAISNTNLSLAGIVAFLLGGMSITASRVLRWWFHG